MLDRLPRGVSLTPAGRTLLPEARLAVRALERGRQAPRSALALEAGELEIATVLSMAVGLLPRHIGVWHERHPNVVDPAARVPAPHPARGRRRAGRRRLRDRAAARAPLGRPARDRRLGGVRRRRAPTDDPLATRRSDRLEELADREWVLYHPDHGLAGIVEEVCRRAGFGPRGDRAHLAGGRRRRGWPPPASGSRSCRTTSSCPRIDGAVLRLEPRAPSRGGGLRADRWSPTAAAFVDILRADGTAAAGGTRLDPSLGAAAQWPPCAPALLLVAACVLSRRCSGSAARRRRSRSRPSPDSVAGRCTHDRRRHSAFKLADRPRSIGGSTVERRDDGTASFVDRARAHIYKHRVPAAACRGAHRRRPVSCTRTRTCRRR